MRHVLLATLALLSLATAANAANATGTRIVYFVRHGEAFKNTIRLAPAGTAQRSASTAPQRG